MIIILSRYYGPVSSLESDYCDEEELRVNAIRDCSNQNNMLWLTTPSPSLSSHHPILLYCSPFLVKESGSLNIAPGSDFGHQHSVLRWNRIEPPAFFQYHSHFLKKQLWIELIAMRSISKGVEICTFITYIYFS